MSKKKSTHRESSRKNKKARKDLNSLVSNLHDAKEKMEDVKTENGVGMKDIFELMSLPSNDVPNEGEHIPVHTLQKIKEQLGKKVKETDEEGNEVLKPLFDEEEKAKMIFGMLAERGINLLDYLEKHLGQEGFDSDVTFSINNTMEKVTTLLQSIGDMQYKKAKLENERSYLEIQKYKADLKKREIEIKEKKNEGGSGNTNVVAVGNPQELLALLSGEKNVEDIQIIEDEKEDE